MLQFSKEEVRGMENSLLLAEVRLNGRETRGLNNSGTTHNCASEQWVRETGIPTKTTGRVVTATLVGGKGLTVEETLLKDVECVIGRYHCVGSWSVMPMTSYNVVLGKPWLTDHNPRIDFSTNPLFFEGGESYQCWDEMTNDGQPAVLVNEALFMNIGQAKKELRRGAECIIVKVEAAANQEDSWEAYQHSAYLMTWTKST